MSKSKWLNLAAALLTALFVVLLILSCSYCVKPPSAAPETPDIIGTDGRPVSAICISDLSVCNIIENVNYTPKKFLIPKHEIGGTSSQTGSETDRADYGTYEFVILNLNPYDVRFKEKQEALSPFLQGDNYWHFTLYLPACFSACNVYVNTDLHARVGDISDYDFTDYTASNYTGVTEYHKAETEPLFIDLKFYTRQAAMSDELWTRATVVTVHYESSGGMTGYLQPPMIGLDSAVREIVKTESAFSLAFSIIAALFLTMLIFASLLKRSFSLLPYILICTGIFFLFALQYTLLYATAMPYFWVAAFRFILHWIVGAACCGLRVKIGKFPVWIVPVALSGVSCILAFLTPYFMHSSLLHRCLFLSDVLLATMICALLFIFIVRSTEFKLSSVVPAVLAAGILVAALFLPTTSRLFSNPISWLCFLLLAITAGYGIAFFVRLERRNAYLTDNLQSEVARQTESLNDIIKTNETLLRYLSHDMRKPVHGAERFLAVLRKNESDAEQLKTIGIIEQKIRVIDESLTELQQYSRQNYPVEQSATFDVGKLLKSVYERLSPDCEANNVTLTCLAGTVKIYAKYNALAAVICNLIFNALEHAECTEIVMTANKRKGVCRITIADNGKGIEPGYDVFQPYVTGKEGNENLGLGLYISRESVQSMGGELTVERSCGKTSFCITFPSFQP